MGDQYIQGDVVIRRVDSIPADAEKVSPGARGYVLAEGEVTGHAHVLERDKAEVYRQDEALFIAVSAPADLVHEEHKTDTLPPGNYQVGQVKEYDPFAEEARRVMD